MHTPRLSEHFIIFLTSFILFQWPCNAFPFIRRISHCANTPTETQLIMHEIQKLTKTLFFRLSKKKKKKLVPFNNFSLKLVKGSLKTVMCNLPLNGAMNIENLWIYLTAFSFLFFFIFTSYNWLLWIQIQSKPLMEICTYFLGKL